MSFTNKPVFWRQCLIEDLASLREGERMLDLKSNFQRMDRFTVISAGVREMRSSVQRSLQSLNGMAGEW